VNYGWDGEEEIRNVNQTSIQHMYSRGPSR
jgi:hypothetical protein